MSKNIYILSHSSLDLLCVVKLYEKYRNEGKVKILVGSTSENLQFFKRIGIPSEVIEYVDFGSRAIDSGPKNIWKLIRGFYKEKRILDEYAKIITVDKNNVLFFSSYTCDPQFGYLAYLTSKTNKVILVDVLQIRPKKASFRSLISWQGFKNLISFLIYRMVFGNIFILAGDESYLFIALELTKFRIEEVSRESIAKISDISKYKVKIPSRAKNAVFLYCENRFGVPASKYISVNQKIVECLLKNEFKIFIKVHPQSQKPLFLNNYNVGYIEKFIPFEFVDLRNVAVVVGLAGATLLSTEEVVTVSFLELIYDQETGNYINAMTQLQQNKNIIFIKSVDNFEAILQRFRCVEPESCGMIF